MDITSTSPAGRRRLKLTPQRGCITNGSSLLPGVDSRSAWVRRAKDVIAQHLRSISGARKTPLPPSGQLVRRAAVLTTEMESLEARFAQGGAAKAVDLDLYIRASGDLRRLLGAIGLRRRSRDISPTLSDYFRR